MGVRSVWALYYVVYNSGQECHELQEPCYWCEDSAKQALKHGEALVRDQWSGVECAYLEEIQVV